MSIDDEVSNSILEYIHQHFPNAVAEEWQHEKQDSINFYIKENNRTLILRVMQESFADLQVEDIQEMLENYNVAQVLRDIGDFPVVVTRSGCIFGSP